MIPIRTVLFDYGNVLSLPQAAGVAQQLADLCGLPLVQFEERYWMHRVAYDLGQLDGPAYWQHFRAIEGQELTADQVSELMRRDAASWEHPNQATVNWAIALREQGVRTAILSNMPAPLRQHLVRDSGWLPAFDHLTFSCDIGVMKPAEAIYRHCLDGVGSEASDALFLDDRPENIDAARALGIHAVQFHSASQVADELQSRYALPSLPLLRAIVSSSPPASAS
jgi:putative hydrolase of the HAD superfamily